MNFKHASLILLILCTLFLSICAISAADNASGDLISEVDDISLEQSPIDTPVKANESSQATTDNTDKNTSGSTNATSDKTPVKKLKASAPIVYNTYKKKGSFKITVKDLDKKLMKNFKIKVKVYTGKKAKTYTLKTNSKGVATLNTKTLKKGTHKVVITSADKAHKLSKTSYIHIGVKKTLTLKIDKTKTFKNGDYFRFFKETRNTQYTKGVYVENLRVYKGSLDGAKSHHIIKVKYTFKNIKGMKITKVSKSDNMFKTKLIVGYKPVLAKVTYIQE